MKINLSDISDTLFFSGSDYDDNEAYLCLQTGDFYYKSDYIDEDEPLPDDLDNDKKYILMPHRYDLDLPHPRDFINDKMPEHIEQLNNIFSRKGAYRRFKDWLIQVDKIDDWHEYENIATEKALRDWCEENNIALED